MSRRDRGPRAARAAGSGGRAEPGRARARDAVAEAPPSAPPPTGRDPWAWACVAAIVPLLARTIGAPVGEAVAEDFDFLHRTIFTGVGSLLDGGGSTAFWRPVAHQIYYAALGPLIVSQPRVVAALHALLLAAGAVLVYRALRARMSGLAASSAAAFPMFSESTRTIVAWPSQFVDLGLYFFSALALHEASRRRLPTALLAGLLALLCKEVAVVTLLLLPWMPGVRAPSERRRWLLACLALLVVWGGAYLGVREAAHLALPHGIEQGGAAASWVAKLAWAFTGSIRALMSLAFAPGAADALALILILAGTGVLVFAVLALPAARARLAARRGWIAWGLGWFTLATTTLAPIHPLWQPNRSHFGATGVGVASAVALEAVHPWAPVALAAGRLALLALAPPPARTISEEAPETGAFMDFARLSRLQRFMSETRGGLVRRYPQAPPHSSVVAMNLPRGLIYALGGDRAAQVWYRDTTVRIVNFTRLAEDSTLHMVAGVQFQPRGAKQVVILSPDAMRAQDRGYRALREGRWEAAIAALAHADSLDPDTTHEVFHGNNAGYRSLAFLRLGRVPEAEREARRALELDDRDKNANRVLCSTLAMQGRLEDATAVLVRMESLYAGEPWLVALRASIEDARRERSGGGPAPGSPIR